MTEITTVLERGPSADLKKSYDSVRSKYKAGTPKGKLKFRYHNFRTFEALVAQGRDFLEELTRKSIKDNELIDLEALEIRLQRTSKMLSAKPSKVQESKRDTSIVLPADLVYRDLYTVGGPDAQVEDTLDVRVAKLKLSGQLERLLRNHHDLDFRKCCEELLAFVNQELPNPECSGAKWEGSVNVLNYWATHVINTRTQGYPEFDGSIAYVVPSMSNVLKAVRGDVTLRAEGFKANLQTQTQTVQRVLRYLQSKDELSRKDISANVEVGIYGDMGKNPLGLPSVFLPHVQGAYMFQVIALARLQEKNGGSFEALFEGDIPHDVRMEVSGEVRNQSKLSEFYGLFYASLDTLGLSEKYEIISKIHVEPVLQ
jgi:hypothetical protein